MGVYVRGYVFETTEQDLKDYFGVCGPVKAVKYDKWISSVTFANATAAATAVSTLDKSTMPGQTRYIDVQADPFKKDKKNKGGGAGKKCKWCDLGECWSHGQIANPKGNSKGNSVKKN